jgi:fructose-bisphosphate aldolase, class I
MKANAYALARFAALSQEADLVPIVEPEVLMEGEHTIDRHSEVTETMIRLTFDELYAHRVDFNAMLLKPNMILAGVECPFQPSVPHVAEQTLYCMMRCVPAAVPGLVFLSGGQSDVQATEHLNEMNRLGNAPWQVSFSFGRALQQPALKLWRGRADGVKAAQEALMHRAQCNSEARFGRYSEDLERASAFEAAIA